MLLINAGLVGLHTGHVRGSRSALAQLIREESSFHLSSYVAGDARGRLSFAWYALMLTAALWGGARDLLRKLVG